jgi:hypothetical protein
MYAPAPQGTLLVGKYSRGKGNRDRVELREKPGILLAILEEYPGTAFEQKKNGCFLTVTNQ